MCFCNYSGIIIPGILLFKIPRVWLEIIQHANFLKYARVSCMIAEFKYHKDMTSVIICDLCMSSLLFMYLCFNVFKQFRYCHKYIVKAKQQFQENFIMCLNRHINCISHQLIYKFLNSFMQRQAIKRRRYF